MYRKQGFLYRNTDLDKDVLEAHFKTLANIINIALQVIISYPSMKYWIMPE